MTWGLSILQEAVSGLFERFVALRTAVKLKAQEQVVHLLFAIHAFQSLECQPVREQVRASDCPCCLVLSQWACLSKYCSAPHASEDRGNREDCPLLGCSC